MRLGELKTSFLTFIDMENTNCNRNIDTYDFMQLDYKYRLQYAYDLENHDPIIPNRLLKHCKYTIGNYYKNNIEITNLIPAKKNLTENEIKAVRYENHLRERVKEREERELEMVKQSIWSLLEKYYLF